ncbi:MAG: hypothetical protein ACK2VD_02740 [Anaerolineae bacterium]
MSAGTGTVSLVSPEILFHSAHASACFACSCLEPAGSGSLRARSSFVDPAGQAMHWHDFGDLEGPGWAANAIGGAHLLYRWGDYAGDGSLQADALRLVDHVLDDGFVRGDGFLWPYWDLRRERFCLNYAHGDAWLCAGSLAAVGAQMLDLAATLGQGSRARRLRRAASGLAAWMADHVSDLPSGWIPRRITPDGGPYPYTPEGRPDPIYDHSADGLFLVELWARLGWLERAATAGDAFVAAGGLWGSINHDTYDDHENVAYAVAFRVLRRVAERLDRPAWQAFAYDVALPAMARYRMAGDEHGVHTRGLFWMEASWDTAYLWENAEVAQAYLEAWAERGEPRARDVALGVLAAIAHHHYGKLGFLSEGIDWNNHVGQRHHVAGDLYGAIRYTEPLLNNLHLLGPTLTYLQAIGYRPPNVRPPGRSAAVVRALSTADRRACGRRASLDALAEARVGKVRVGVGIEPAPGAEGKVAGWESLLGRLGIPLGHPYSAPHLLLGEAVRGMDRYGIGSALQAGAILTPGAVLALIERGWGPAIGVARLEGVSEAGERLSEDPLNGASRGARRPAPGGEDRFVGYAVGLLPGARTRMLSWWEGPDGRWLGVAAVAVSIRGGGRALVLPYELGSAEPVKWTPRRARAAWSGWLGWAWGMRVPVQVNPAAWKTGEAEVDVCLWVDPGDGSALLTVANRAPQPAVVGLSLPGLAGGGNRLGPGGTWAPVGRPSELALPVGGSVAIRWPAGAAMVQAF